MTAVLSQTHSKPSKRSVDIEREENYAKKINQTNKNDSSRKNVVFPNIAHLNAILPWRGATGYLNTKLGS